MTSLLVGEYSAEDVSEGPEFAIAVGAPLLQVGMLGGFSRAETVAEAAAHRRLPELIR